MHRHIFTKSLIALSAIVVFAHSASADTINLMWDPNPEESVIGYKVHVGTQSGTYTQHIDVGPTTAWSYTSAVAGQQYCFAVTAYASGPVEGPRSNEVCGYSNWPPALTNPGAQSSTVGQADSLQLAGSDPKGDVLTYSASGLPPGLALMASTGYISGTPTTAGSYAVTARAGDGVLTASQTFTWTVTAKDTTAPVVTITGPTSASTYTAAAMTLPLSGTASDGTGVTQVTWVNSRGGSGTASGTTSWSVGAIALQAGSNLLTVTARDAAGNSSSDTLTVTVNNAPALASVPNQSSAINLATTLQLAGSDPNGDTLTYSATGLPAGLAVAAASGLISGTPTKAGTYTVTASVSDGSHSASRSFTWTITAPDTTAPAISITKPTTAATRTTATLTIDLSGTASDNVGVTRVTWSNDRGGSGTATGTTSWSVTGIALQPGANLLTVTAFDAAGNTRTDVLTVTFTNPVRIVSLTADKPSPQPVGSTITFTVVAAGSDGQYLYQWRLYDGTRWVTKVNWNSSNKYVWKPTAATSLYRMQAQVRSGGKAAITTIDFPIVP